MAHLPVLPYIPIRVAEYKVENYLLLFWDETDCGLVKIQQLYYIILYYSILYYIILYYITFAKLPQSVEQIRNRSFPHARYAIDDIMAMS